MFIDLLLLLSLGPIIGFFIYYLNDDRRKSEEYFRQGDLFPEA